MWLDMDIVVFNVEHSASLYMPNFVRPLNVYAPNFPCKEDNTKHLPSQVSIIQDDDSLQINVI